MKSPESLVELYTSAATACDRDALLALYSPEVRLFDLMMPWQYRGVDAWANQIDRWFANTGSDPKVEAEDVEVRSTDQLSVLTMNMLYSHADDSGERFSMTNRLTWVAVPHGDDWHIIHEHTSVPLSEENMSPVFGPG